MINIAVAVWGTFLFAKSETDPTSHPPGQSYLPLQDDQILYADQPVALVVATTRDQAAYAGTLIGIQYESSPPAVFDRPAAKEAVQPPQFLWPVASSVYR